MYSSTSNRQPVTEARHGQSRNHLRATCDTNNSFAGSRSSRNRQFRVADKRQHSIVDSDVGPYEPSLLDRGQRILFRNIRQRKGVGRSLATDRGETPASPCAILG
jgi:hypothetical protein